jgi:hypothetical protein
MPRSAVALVASMLAAPAAMASPLDLRKDLPICNWRLPQVQDCHIPDWDVAISLMANPPSRERQPNAHGEYKLYERERERKT